MKNTLRNLAPAAVVLGVICWLCWPHLSSGDSGLPDLGGGALARVDKEQLTPTMAAVCARNPFQPVTETADTAAPGSGSPLVPRDGSPEPDNPPIDPLDVVRSLELRGTFVGGIRKCALINDQLCFEGEPIPTKWEGEVRCTLVRVQRDAVWVDAAGSQFRLDYSQWHESAPAGASAPTPTQDASRPAAATFDSSAGFFELLEKLQEIIKP